MILIHESERFLVEGFPPELFDESHIEINGSPHLIKAGYATKVRITEKKSNRSMYSSVYHSTPQADTELLDDTADFLLKIFDKRAH